MSILLNESLELRSGWRFLLYVAVFVAALYATAASLSVILPEDLTGELAFLGLNAVALAVPAVVATIFMIRFVDHVPPLAFGVGFHERWGRDFGLGLALAASMVAALVGAFAITGTLRVSLSAGDTTVSTVSGVVLVLFVSAANEELVFRGYPLQVLMNGIGRWPAVVVMSAIFGLGHYLNPNATWLGSANTFLAGILLCLAYVRTRSLWFPYGIHIGWNVGLGPGLGFALSGIDLSSIWHTETAGADWITGGEYGPEAGLLVTGIMLAAVAAVASTGRLKVSPSLDLLLERHAGKVYRGGQSLSPFQRSAEAGLSRSSPGELGRGGS